MDENKIFESILNKKPLKESSRYDNDILAQDSWDREEFEELEKNATEIMRKAVAEICQKNMFTVSDSEEEYVTERLVDIIMHSDTWQEAADNC